MVEVMIGSVTFVPCAAKNCVVLKPPLLMSLGAGVPLNMSGATVRYPALAKLSANLEESQVLIPKIDNDTITDNLFCASWIPKTSVR